MSACLAALGMGRRVVVWPQRCRLASEKKLLVIEFFLSLTQIEYLVFFSLRHDVGVFVLVALPHAEPRGGEPDLSAEPAVLDI